MPYGRKIGRTDRRQESRSRVAVDEAAGVESAGAVSQDRVDDVGLGDHGDDLLCPEPAWRGALHATSRKLVARTFIQTRGPRPGLPAERHPVASPMPPRRPPTHRVGRRYLPAVVLRSCSRRVRDWTRSVRPLSDLCTQGKRRGLLTVRLATRPDRPSTASVRPMHGARCSPSRVRFPPTAPHNPLGTRDLARPPFPVLLLPCSGNSHRPSPQPPRDARNGRVRSHSRSARASHDARAPALL